MAGADPADLEIQQIAMSECWAEQALKNVINSILTTTCATESELFLTDTDVKNNFRWDVACTHPYKGNRGSSSKPVHYNHLRNILVEEYGAIVVTGIEADDELGKQQTANTIIASIDKDLLMIPGLHYNLATKEFLYASDPGSLRLDRSGKKPALKGVGFKWFCAQMLLGDAVDNIVCINRMGPVKVYNLLNNVHEIKDMWDIITAVYESKESVARRDENATLLWMQRPEALTWQEYLENNL
jgi:hypothetical protein